MSPTPKLLSITGLLIILTASCANAQDPQFSQFYNAPLYLNPGFVGLTKAGRAGLNYRLQGQGDAAKFTTTSTFLDYNINDFNLSSGLLLLSDREEYTGYRAFSMAVPVSYVFQVNQSLAIKPAVEPSFTNKKTDFSDLLFGDQLDPSGNYIGNSREVITNGSQVQFFNLAFGVVSYTDKVWAGFSIHNLIENQNTSFIDGGHSKLSRRYTVHGGIRISAKSRKRKPTQAYMPTFNYTHQGNFNQLDIGMYGLIDPVTFGLTYRGVPITSKDQQAISTLIGMNLLNFSFGYSFDLILNRELRTGGIHELSVSMTFDWRNPKNPPRSMKRLKCPAIL